MSLDLRPREQSSRFRAIRISVWLALAVAFAGAVVYHHVTGPTSPPLPATVTLYGFSAMESVMNEAILPAFQKEWEVRTGQKVEFITTYAGSAVVTREILRKVPVQVAILSSELDARRLARSGLATVSSRRRLPHSGVVSRSPVVLLTRAGNPRDVRDFDDLARDGIELVHADPVRSGVAEWAILSVYAATYRDGEDRQRAVQRVADVWNNVVTVAPSARAALREFLRGTGDVLVTYESEAILASRSGETLTVYPPITLISEHIACKITPNVGEDERELVDALLEFLWSAEAQSSLVRYGFRSVDTRRNHANAAFPAVSGPLTLEDLGGADVVDRSVIEPLWDNRVFSTPSPGG